MRRIGRSLLLVLGSVLMFPFLGSFYWTHRDDWFNRALDEVLRFLNGGFSPACNVGLAVVAWFFLMFGVGVVIALTAGISLFLEIRRSRRALRASSESA